MMEVLWYILAISIGIRCDTKNNESGIKYFIKKIVKRRGSLTYKVIIWGLGNEYQRFYNLIKYEELKGNIDVTAIVDKNTWRWCTTVDGYRVISIKEIVNYKFDYIIVTSSRYYNDIVNEAILLGINRDLLVPIRVFQIPYFNFSEYVQLKKNPVSIISDDCWGGKIYNYLGLRFDSPFINFFINNDDFVKLVSNLKSYMSEPLKLEQQETIIDMPIGSLGEGEEKVYLYFNHAYSFEEAKVDFERRKRRLNMDNLFIKMQYGWGRYSKDVVCEYDRLSYNKKIFFAPFEIGIKAEIVSDYFREGYTRKNLRETCCIEPRDFRGYIQNIDLMAREYNIIHMLITGEVVKRIVS